VVANCGFHLFDHPAARETRQAPQPGHFMQNMLGARRLLGGGVIVGFDGGH